MVGFRNFYKFISMYLGISIFVNGIVKFFFVIYVFGKLKKLYDVMYV